MGMTLQLKALVRRTVASVFGDGVSEPQINTRGDFLVAQGLPPKAELARLGASWYCSIATGSAFTPVAAMPTTRSELTLRNGNTDNTCFVIDAVGFMSLTSLAAASGITILGQINAAAALTDDTAQLISSPTGKVYSGSATRAVATTTAVANKWMALAASGGISTTTTIGTGLVAEVQGGWILKPGFTFHTNAVFSTAAGTAIGWIAWHEVTLPLV